MQKKTLWVTLHMHQLDILTVTPLYVNKKKKVPMTKSKGFDIKVSTEPTYWYSNHINPWLSQHAIACTTNGMKNSNMPVIQV